jgi:hypothetical protein
MCNDDDDDDDDDMSYGKDEADTNGGGEANEDDVAVETTVPSGEDSRFHRLCLVKTGGCSNCEESVSVDDDG